MRRSAKILIAIVPTLLLTIIFIVSKPIPEKELSPLPVLSMKITDRSGEILREILSEQGSRAYWVDSDSLPEYVINAVCAAEDKRFYTHPGIDPLAIARSFYRNLVSRRIVTGGSTITQQVIRNIYRHPRSFNSKIIEAWYALRLERTLSKSGILTQYLNRVSYGNGVHGIEAASRFYFGKPADHLSVAEAAFLTAVPNAPAIYNPYRTYEHVLRRQEYILNRMRNLGYITEEEYTRAVDEPVILIVPQRNFLAPHFTEMVLESFPEEKKGTIRSVTTTLDLRIQETVELILKSHIRNLRNYHVTNGAVVVIDNKTGDILALAGSADFLNDRKHGQVNGVRALRQPGSALKPFTYGLALESGMTAADMLADIPYYALSSEGSFSPENYDGKYHGPVLLRSALACSFNVPAVRIAERVGIEALLARMREAGIRSLDKPASHYGLGLTLGNGEVSLLELTMAYASFANGGKYRNHRIIGEFIYSGESVESMPVDSVSHVVFTPQIAHILTDILADNNARSPAFGPDSPLSLPFPCAVKTGTTKDYRDNWTVGYTSEFTVGVWIGNFDGTPMRGISGITGAGTVFRDIILYLNTVKPGKEFIAPPGIEEVRICARSGELPTDLCRSTVTEKFIRGTEPTGGCTVHRVIPIDIRTMRYADSHTPDQFVQNRIAEIYPPLYDTWFETRVYDGRITVSDVYDPNEDLRFYSGTDYERVNAEIEEADRRKTGHERFAILFPEDGAVFKVDPILRKEFQNVKINLAVGKEFHNVRLLQNGEVMENVGTGPSLTWNLRRGEFEFELVATHNGSEVRSNPVRIIVR
jgi:penicillin-binding protein 1C